MLLQGAGETTVCNECIDLSEPPQSEPFSGQFIAFVWIGHAFFSESPLQSFCCTTNESWLRVRCYKPTLTDAIAALSVTV